MKIEYILVLKDLNIYKSSDDNPDNEVPNIQDILKNCFEKVGQDSFKLRYKRSNYVINYNCSSYRINNERNNIAYYLIFSYGNSKNLHIASVLDYVHDCFISNINKGKLKFNIIISYDERSLYFCSKAYPYFSIFESKLRTLILSLLTKSFGILWAKKTLTENQIKKIKEKIQGASFEKIASEALYEMDLSSLESYLFAKTRDMSAEDVIDNYLSSDSLRKLNIEEIDAIIEKARPKSNWERYFSNKVKIDLLEEKLTIIREERNKVAHIKHYFMRDYTEDIKILTDFIKKLDEAINSLENNTMNEKDSINTIYSFNQLLESFSSFSGSLKRAKEVSQVISESLSSITNAIANINLIKTPQITASALKAAQIGINNVNIQSATQAAAMLKEIKLNIPKINLAAIEASLSHIPKINLPVLDGNLINIPEINVPIIDDANLHISANLQQQLQNLRTYILNENK